MNAPYNQDVLAAAEACFAQASQLLYCEPDAEVVADQVAERPFQNAPFGTYMRFATARNPLTRMLASSVNEPNDSIDSVGRVNSKNASSGRPRSSSRHSAAKHSMTNPMP